jgi:aspartyl-tRNA(Asn)/glutamyl-tRNA(Gln) amidotransferase subunit A
VRAAYSNADVLLLPVIGIPTPTIEETAYAGAADQPQIVERITRFTRWVNYLGLPALAVPCGFSGSGMPVGMQLVGRPYSERTLLRVGYAYERASDWHARRPAPPC